jgi:hypothetical protein
MYGDSWGAEHPETITTIPNKTRSATASSYMIRPQRLQPDNPPRRSAECRTPCSATQASRSWQTCRTTPRDDGENHDESEEKARNWLDIGNEGKKRKHISSEPAASVFIPVRAFTILAPPVINCDARLPCLSIRER